MYEDFAQWGTIRVFSFLWGHPIFFSGNATNIIGTFSPFLVNKMCKSIPKLITIHFHGPTQLPEGFKTPTAVGEQQSFLMNY